MTAFERGEKYLRTFGPKESDPERRGLVDDTIARYLEQTRQPNSAVQTRQVAEILRHLDHDYAVQALKGVFEDLINLPASTKYEVAQLLALLYDTPGRVEEVIDAKAYPIKHSGEYLGEYLGKTIQLRFVGSFDHQLDEDQRTRIPWEIQPLDMYGTMAVSSYNNPSYEYFGGIIGTFSYYDIKPLPQSERLEESPREDWQQPRLEAPQYYVTVKPLTESDLFYSQTAESAVTSAKQQELLKYFRGSYKEVGQHDFFRRCGIPLQALPVKEQVALYQLLSQYDHGRTGNRAELKVIANDIAGDINKLRAYTLCFAHTGSLKLITEQTNGTQPKLLKHQLAQPYTEHNPQQRNPLETLIDFVDRAEKTAQQLHQELLIHYPDIDLPIDDIVHGLVVGALHDLGDINNIAAKDAYRVTVQQRASEIGLGLTFFRELVGVMQQDHSDLQSYRKRQSSLLTLLDRNPAFKPVVVEALIKLQKLKPSPELFWREDRTMTEYNERTGVDIIALAKDIAEGNDQEILFEAGAGCGNGIAERHNKALNKHYADFSIVNEVYYPIRRLITELIDFDALASASDVLLDTADRAALSDYIYKVLYLKEGTTALSNVDDNYDEAIKASITTDPNNLKTALSTLGEKLIVARAVPSETGVVPQANKKKLYPKPIIAAKQSPQFQAALQQFSTQPSNFLKPELLQTDLKQHIPIFPAGMMLGDFLDIKHLKSKQIKFGVDVRAAVYLEDSTKYQDFLVQMADKLKTGGIYVSDSVRENFGKVYRLPELVRVQEQLQGFPGDYQMYIITGPGVPGDDFNTTKAIRSVIITKGTQDRTSTIQNRLTDSTYELHTLADIVGNTDYLSKLDDAPKGKKNSDRVIAVQAELAAKRASPTLA